MEFYNKRILLICREVYSFPFYYLTKKWLKNNTVAAYFFSPSETKYNENPSNSYSYYAFKRIDGLKMYTSNGISDEFTSILNKNEIIDSDFLNEIESKYSYFLNVNQQIMSTQCLTRHYHFRNFWHSTTYTQQLNWIILNYKDCLRVLDDFQPDVILDCDNAELGRCVMRELAYYRKIPYIYADYTRYEKQFIPSYCHGLRINPELQEKFNYYQFSDNDLIKSELEYVRDFKSKQSIMSDIYKNTVTSQYKADNLFKILRNIYWYLKLHYLQDIKAWCWPTKIKNPILYPDSFQYLKFLIKYEIKHAYLLSTKSFFDKPVEGEKYVYMPLHLIPESTTFSLAPLYTNELTIIEAVSKSLPAGWWLYVKEHQAMIGERGMEFYRRVKKIPNVKLVQINFYNDPKPWILNSQGVVTISGTSAYEAALLGKHSIIFSNVAFSLIKGVKRAHSFEELSTLFQEFGDEIDNEKSCAAYIAAIKAVGVSFDSSHIDTASYNYINTDKTPDKDYMTAIASLEKLFVHGYDWYINNKNKIS